MNQKVAQKAGIASGIARQSPRLIADKEAAVILHLSGRDTGQIQRVMPHRQRAEIRRWLIAKGIYKTAGRGAATKGKKLKKRSNPISLIKAEYASDFKRILKTDTLIHWGNHPACAAYNALRRYYRNHDKILAQLKSGYERTSERVRIKKLLSSRIHKAITRNGKGARKAASTMELIGCSIAEVRAHLESKFSAGMTWHNCGRNGWHIDHIQPCDSFQLEDPAQQHDCFCFTNLQPLWEADNISKSNHWPPQNRIFPGLAD